MDGIDVQGRIVLFDKLMYKFILTDIYLKLDRQTDGEERMSLN